MGEVPEQSVADGQPQEGDEDVGKGGGGNSTTSGEGGGEEEEKSVYLYVGRDAQPAFQYKMEDILSKQELHGDAVEVCVCVYVRVCVFGV
jgi:hypothetical protein